MKKPRYLLSGAGIIVLCLVVFYSTDIIGKSQISSALSAEKRADIIIIDNMNLFGKLEKPSVEFLHDAHTEALAKKNKSCDTCHLKQEDQFYPKYKRVKDTNREEVMNIYHDGCIACHGEMRLAGEKAGPVECDDCHREQKKYTSVRQPMGFDQSLHGRHVQAYEKKCEQCHHEYDEKTKKLFYEKGKEGTCRYCHKRETEDNRLSMRISAHIDCINCHLKNKEKNQGKESVDFPVNCSGCHDSAAQKKIKKLDIIPRLERNQPDMVMIKTGIESLDVPGKNRMSLVPFNHQAHEGYNNTCRVCHHEQMKKCSECHTLGGSAEGKGVNLELAMHKKDAERSCVGCHTIQYSKENNCAGCHQFTAADDKMSDNVCSVCHMKLPEGMKLDENTAQLLLESRPEKPETYSQEDIPEKIVMDKFSKKYEPVEFPHRKIVNSITEKIKDSKLANYFHAEKETVCSGCHHNIPVSEKLTGCSNCHPKTFNVKDMHKPGIIGAYHIQCMDCHATMGIEKVGCVECHKEKKDESSADSGQAPTTPE